jgi:hypothetical protein
MALKARLSGQARHTPHQAPEPALPHLFHHLLHLGMLLQ